VEQDIKEKNQCSWRHVHSSNKKELSKTARKEEKVSGRKLGVLCMAK
jgi:hypothetical protein